MYWNAMNDNQSHSINKEEDQQKIRFFTKPNNIMDLYYHFNQ